MTNKNNQVIDDDIDDSLLKTVFRIYKFKGLWQHLVFFIVIPIIIVILTIISVFNDPVGGTSEQNSIILFLQSFLPVSMQIVAALVAISTAGVVLIFPHKEGDFVKFLYENNIYDGVLAIFVEPVVIGFFNIFWAIGMLFTIYSYATPLPLSIIYVIYAIFTFLYVFYSFCKLYSAFRMLGKERIKFEKLKNNNKI